ncbi:DUF502 domain-containing protein [Panacibacter ginsenosidivorans]|uniref:DUF502 domain-containing protein n=1 Tax=Panacibacter ginsenosidivorans TaxID=1813871 RepID=A0A5B8V9D5_9BACT|nr:DUF502 domain-containing protein [Panacibacter ginsenosidivorans]QEC68130.1 DUF502 domain-containing protein [Panacibacter ginsenosidivorans]
MSDWKHRVSDSFHWKKLLQYFFQGLIIIAPLGITIYAVWWLFTTVDNILPNIIHSLFPQLLGTDGEGELKRIPGLGFIVAILIVLFVGRVSSSFVMSRLVDLLDGLLERTPGIKFIYKSVKDFLEAFTGNKRKFDKPVLANVDGADIWRLGFITQESAANFQMAEYSVVYIPLSYALTGVMYFVPKEKIKILDHISSAEAMKFAVSGGVSEVD